jgi:crotonobetainyl-CoA:carnitine CoA-transferase CaiB-like acyl-CoA transferase
MPGALDGITVLDLTWGTAGPMTTMLLADNGADVIRIERPGGEPFDEPDGYRVWHRGKRSAEFDLHDAGDLARFRALARTADVLVESFAPGVTERLGIDAETLQAENQRLIYTSITGYGRDNRHSDRPAYDGLVLARTGLQWECRGWSGSPMGRINGQAPVDPDVNVPDDIRIGGRDDGPVFLATPVPSVWTAYLANIGIAAALRAREVIGVGQRVETSLLQGALLNAGTFWQRVDNYDAPGYELHVLDRRQTWGLVAAQDRWICLWPINHDWATAAGAADTLRLPPPGTDWRMASIGQTITERLDALERAASTIRRFPADAWVELATHSDEAPCQLVRSPEEALTDPSQLADGSVVEVDDPELGLLRETGLVYRLHGTPGRVRASAPRRGEHTEQVHAAAAAGPDAAAPAPAPAPAAELNGPLDGVRVLDFGAAVAGPWAAQLLSDLGADVIKIDPARQAFWLSTHMGFGVNRSKRHLGLDMKTAGGMAIARRLIESADVVLLNLRPQAARKLGLDYESVRALNPSIVYCHTRGHEDGPRSALPGNDQTGNALGGTEWEDGGCWSGGRPYFGVTTGGDLGNGYLAAIAITKALFHRERTGAGQLVDASILNASMFNNSRIYSTPDGKRFDRPLLDAKQLGLSPHYRLYQAADGWLCLAAVSPDSRAALERLVPSAAGLTGDSLVQALEAWFAPRKAREAFAELDGAGVPCEISDPDFPLGLFDDADLFDRGWLTTCQHPALGRADTFGAGIDFSRTPAQPGGEPAVFGRDTRAVLAELGYSAEQIQEFVAGGAVIAS